MKSRKRTYKSETKMKNRNRKSEMEMKNKNWKWRSGAKMIDRENRSAYDKKH